MIFLVKAVFTHFSGQLWTGRGLSLHLITSSLIKGKHGHDASEYLMLISVDLNDFILRFQISLISIKKIYQTLETALNQISNTSKFVKNTLLRVVFFQLSFRCLELWLNTFLVVFRQYIIKSRFKAANQFSVKRAGPGQDKLSLKTYHVKAN